jgi:hypothetical protein
VAAARLDGKDYRRRLRTVAEPGAVSVVVVLQGVLHPPHAPGGPFVLADAGLQVNLKQPRPDRPAPQE